MLEKVSFKKHSGKYFHFIIRQNEHDQNNNIVTVEN